MRSAWHSAPQHSTARHTSLQHNLVCHASPQHSMTGATLSYQSNILHCLASCWAAPCNMQMGLLADTVQCSIVQHCSHRLHANPPLMQQRACADGSEWRQRIEQEAEHFLDVSAWTVGDIASKISSDEIQVAINLNGYTKGARNEIFALLPAPVQTSYMGFPATTGITSHLTRAFPQQQVSPLCILHGLPSNNRHCLSTYMGFSATTGFTSHLTQASQQQQALPLILHRLPQNNRSRLSTFYSRVLPSYMEQP